MKKAILVRTWSAPESGSSGSAGGFWFSCTLHTQTAQHMSEKTGVLCGSDALTLYFAVALYCKWLFLERLCQLEVARAHQTPNLSLLSWKAASMCMRGLYNWRQVEARMKSRETAGILMGGPCSLWLGKQG